MYTLNNIPLTAYGIYPGRANGSNLALSGFLDMPKRLGKTFHSWGDSYGVEPYVAASEIAFGGRVLEFNGMVKANNRADAIEKLQGFYNDIAAFTTLVPLNCDWGTFQVYVKDEIQVEYIALGYATIKVRFVEPVLSYTNEIHTSEGDTLQDSDGNTLVFNDPIAAGTETGMYTLDGLPLSYFGAMVKSSENLLSASALKEQSFIAYQKEGYQLTKRQTDAVTLNLLLKAATFGGLKSNITNLQTLLASPGTRSLNVDGYTRNCFCVDGFQVDNINVLTSLAVAELRCTLLMAAPLSLALNTLMLTSDGDTITDAESNLITYN